MTKVYTILTLNKVKIKKKRKEKENRKFIKEK